MSRETCMFIGDVHLTDKVPGSVMLEQDEWIAVQLKRLRLLVDRANELGIPVLVAGDLFDTPKVLSPYFFSSIVNVLMGVRTPWCVIPGQHDLPYHSMERFQDCWLHSLGNVLKKIESVTFFEVLDGTAPICLDHDDIVVFPYPWGVRPVDGDYDNSYYMASEDYTTIALSHRGVWKDKAPYPGASEADSLGPLKKEYSKFDVAVFGDFHHHWVHEERNISVVNCGCQFPRTKAEAKYPNPKICYLLGDGSIWIEDLGAPEYEIISNTETVGDDAFQVFVHNLQDDGGDDIAISFEDNIKKYINEEGTSKPVSDMVLSTMRECKENSK